MKYNELHVTSNKRPNRVGRGIAAGQGKTAGRGTKGQMSRTGSRKRPGFEGGQTPLMQRLPKLHGFRTMKVKPVNVYTGQLNDLKTTVVDTTTLAKAGLIDNPHLRVTLLVKGKLTAKLDVKLSGASVAAIEAINQAGGSYEPVAQVARPVTHTKKD
jgi:large subunit ribosomal protein L15